MTVPWDSRWKEIPGFPGYYLSQYGQVFSMKRMKLMRLYRNQHGVLCVRLFQKFPGEMSKGFNRSVDKMVEAIFPKEGNVFDDVIADMLKQENDQLEKFLNEAAVSLGLTPEEFAEQYELEVYHGIPVMADSLFEDSVQYRTNTTYKLRPKEKN